QPTQLTFIIGGNGSGKSTLAKVLSGLYVPATGSLWLGETRISDLNREWYRQHFSVIFSDFHLFEDLPPIERKSSFDVERYLDALGLSHKVRIENGRFSTIALSQGQRKRLALLSAVLEDRPIYIFDEWAADQDPTFKKVFYRSLLGDLK